MSDIDTRLVRIPVSGATLEGDLGRPEGATGLVVFAHGSGSSRHSPRNRFVAHRLQQAGLATLLVDLLSQREEEIDLLTARLRFDISLLARRVEDIVGWAVLEPELAPMRLGLFGSSTGAAAALVAAAAQPDVVAAVVSRGGRPDLAAEALAHVRAPTLLVVGGADEGVIELNEYALGRLRGHKQLVLVPGATHLFEEPGALERVSQLAADWFVEHLAAPPPIERGASRHVGV